MNPQEEHLHHQEIINYYVECNNSYRDAMNMDKNMQLNLGLWYKETKNIDEALQNLNQEIATQVHINESDYILDAGCGVGGTAIFLAKKYGCKVQGISITPQQIEQAKKNAKQHGVSHLVDFKIMDYMNTTYADSTFTVITGIESICYAEPKIDFLKEAYRLLKKGGRIALAENLQGKKDLTATEYTSLYTNAFNGCKVKSLDTKQQYIRNLESLKFTDIHCQDFTSFIKPSIKRLRRIWYLAYAYNTVHRLVGKPFSKTKEANTKMCYHLLSSLNKGLWEYGIITATK